MPRHTIRCGINDQPNIVVPTETPVTAPLAPAMDDSALDHQMANGILDAEQEVDGLAAKANPHDKVNTVPAVQIIQVPFRKLRKSNETTIHEHLIDPRYGSCFNRPLGFLIGLEIGQDRLALEKKKMFDAKRDLAKCIAIRENLVGVLQTAVEFCGDRNALHIAGYGGEIVKNLHIVEKNASDPIKEEKAIEASRQNLKRRAEEMQVENEETVHLAKKFKKHVDNGGVIMADEPVDLDKNEGIMSMTIRNAVDEQAAAVYMMVERELQHIEYYKLKLRESDARYKDLCRAHMLVYLELKREGWENIPLAYRRPGHWFQ